MYSKKVVHAEDFVGSYSSASKLAEQEVDLGYRV